MRKKQTLHWSLVGVILLIIFLCLWMIRMRRLLNNGMTISTNGTPVETTSVQSSPRESPVMFLGSEATTEFVRVSNAVSSPPAQTARYRCNMSVTPTVLQETLVLCFHRGQQLLPCSSAVSVYSPVWIVGTTQSGLIERDPHSSNFRSCSEWFKRGGQNCNDDKDDVFVPADGWNNGLSRPCCTRAAWSGCLPDKLFVCGHLSC